MKANEDQMTEEILTELRDVLFQIAGREVNPDGRLLSYIVKKAKAARDEAILDCINVCLKPVHKGRGISPDALMIRDNIALMEKQL